MNLGHFTATFQFVADVLGGKRGTKVAIGGTRAFAVPGHIQIPSLPPNSRRAVRRGRMYLDHESAHQRFTDFDAWRTRATGSVLDDLSNILEDVRCELLAGRKYPGCAINLREGVADLVEEGEMGNVEADASDPYDWFFQWFLAHTRSTYLGQTALVPAKRKARALLAPQMGPVLDGVEHLCRRIPLLSDTTAALALAREVFELLQREAAGQPQDPGEDEDPEPQEGGRPDQAPSDFGDGDPGAAGSDPSGGPSGDNSPSDDDPGGGPSGAMPPTAAPDPCEPPTSSPHHVPGNLGSGDDGIGDSGAKGSRADIAGEILAGPADPDAGEKYDLGAVLRKDLEGSAAPQRNPFGEFILPGQDVPPVSYGRKVTLQEVRRESTALRVRLCGLVQSSRLLYTLPRQTGKRLSAKHLHRVAAGDCRIWESKVREEDVNTAGVLLLDRSDSMEWGQAPLPIDVASRAVLAAIDALRGIPGFASAAAAFPGVPNPRQRARGDWEDYDANSVALLTGFEETLAKTVPRYGISAEGGTPLAMALWWGIWQLLLRPEPRKILLVATDGRPDAPPAVQRALERAGELGIETLGIGIKLPDIEKFFPKPRSRVIQDVREFPGALFGMLQENLTGRRAA